MVQLMFDGVYLNSDVWINGHHLGHRPNGYVSFYYDITPHLKKKGNVIAVRVDHSKPLTGRWYTGSGIYRSVHLLVHNQTYIEPWGVFFQTPEVNDMKATCMVEVEFVNSTGKELTVKSELIDQSGKVVGLDEKMSSGKSKGNNNKTLSVDVIKPRLWSTDNPYVYTLRTSLYVKGKF